MIATLNEVMLFGTGIERQFLCPVHNDHNPSASVNSFTGLWFCYSCGARGKYDTTTVDHESFHRQLQDFLNLEETRVEYPESYLNQFDSLGPGDYWLSRFSRGITRQHRLGQTFDGRYATIPVRSDTGVLVGVIRRDLTGTDKQKYRYPYRLKISSYLYNYSECTDDVILLTEGATDTVAANEVGVQAMATYRNGISEAQLSLLRRYAPRAVYVAYDQDKAGDQGAETVIKALSGFTEAHRLTWGDYKDLASIPRKDRKKLAKALDRLERV